jgi:hypothetical protein
MRSAGNFHPEWGYLAPAPSFLRTARIALVATAIGATAGVVVVVSLVERPGSNDDNTSIAAHALVTSAPVIAPPVSPQPAHALAAGARPRLAPGGKAAVASMPAPASNRAVATTPAASNAALAAPVTPALAGLIASTESQPMIVEAEPVPAQTDGATVSDQAPAKKVASKKRHRGSSATRRWQAASNARKHWRDNGGLAPLLRLFSFRSPSSWSN